MFGYLKDYLLLKGNPDLQIELSKWIADLKLHYDKHPAAGAREIDPPYIKSGRKAVDDWFGIPAGIREQIERGEY